MWVSTRVEEKLLALDRHPAWSVAEEAAAYAEALVQVVEEDQGRTWCDGDIRFGDFILIIDSDTEVPRDCLLDAASEMEQNPRTAILQYASVSSLQQVLSPCSAILTFRPGCHERHRLFLRKGYYLVYQPHLYSDSLRRCLW
jgi:hypothetical protein